MSTPEPVVPPAEGEVAAPSDGATSSTRLMREATTRVRANRVPGLTIHSGWLADLRYGISLNGESRAIRSAGPFLGGLRTDKERSGAIRAAAIRAVHKDATSSDRLSLGASFARLAAASGGSSIERQVGTLPLLDLETAAATFDSLVGRCAKAGIPINFPSLASTLVHWGSGATTRSQQVRNRIVLDFHSAPTSAAQR